MKVEKGHGAAVAGLMQRRLEARPRLDEGLFLIVVVYGVLACTQAGVVIHKTVVGLSVYDMRQLRVQFAAPFPISLELAPFREKRVKNCKITGMPFKIYPCLEIDNFYS